MISKFLRNCSSLVLLFPLLQLLRLDMLNAAPSGPESDTCSTLVQSRFFGFFLSSSVFPSTPCSWTLQNPDPRRYTIFIKVTKPTRDCIPRQHGPSSLTPSWRRHEPSSGWRASTRWWSCVMPLPTLPSWKPGNNSCRSGKGCPERVLDPGMEMGNLRWSILWLGSVTPAWLPVKCCANGWRTAWPTVPPTGPVASCRHHANVGTSPHRTKKPVDATGTGYTWRTASLLWKKEQLTLTLAVS